MFRINNIQELFFGQHQDYNLLSRMLLNFNKSYFQNTLDIIKLIVLFDNSTCMAFISQENNRPSVSLATHCFKKIDRSCYLKLKEK